MTLDWRSAGLFLTADSAWRRRVWIGGLVLMLPVVGWPMVLGYRRWVVLALVRGDAQVLPPWRGNLRAILVDGFGAVAVIHLWYAPLYVWLGLRLSATGAVRDVPWGAACLVVLLVPICTTMIVPALLMWLRFVAEPQVSLGAAELAAIGLAFAAITFVIPAGFLQVSRTGSLLSAFALDRDLRLIASNFRRYLEAWVGSGLLSLAGHLCFPLSPFGIVWCYLAIVYCFNEVPLAPDAGDDPEYLRGASFRYLRDRHWARYRVEPWGLVDRYARIERDAGPLGAGSPAFSGVRLGFLHAPLPGGGGFRGPAAADPD